MTWLELALLICALVGITAGAFLVAQRPSFWLGMGMAVFNALLPKIRAYVTKRMTPEQEEAFRNCMRRGGEWDHHRKRCKR